MTPTERAKALTQKRIARRVKEFAEVADTNEKVEIFEEIMRQRDAIQESQQKISTDRLLTAKVIVLDAKMIENFDSYVNWLGILMDRWAYHEEVTFWVGVLDKDWSKEYKEYLEDIIDRNCLEKVNVVPYSLMPFLVRGFFSILCAFVQEKESLEPIEAIKQAKRSTVFMLAK